MFTFITRRFRRTPEPTESRTWDRATVFRDIEWGVNAARLVLDDDDIKASELRIVKQAEADERLGRAMPGSDDAA